MSVQSKKYLNLLYIVFLIFSISYMLIQPDIIVKSIKDTISVFVLTVLPTLFPFILCSQMIIMLNGARIIGYPLSIITRLLKMDAEVSGAYAASLIGGYPSGAASLSLLYNKDKLHGKYLSGMLLCSNCGPMFVIGTVGTVLLNSYDAGIIILCSHILGGVINAFLFAGVKEKEEDRKQKTKKQHVSREQGNIFYMLDKSIINTTKIMIKIFAFMGLFKLIGDAVFASGENMLNEISAGEVIFRGLLEIMDGSISASKLGFDAAASAICAIVSFGGMSAVFQSISVAKEVPFSKPLFIAGKLSHGLISGCICYVLIRIIPISIDVYSYSDIDAVNAQSALPIYFFALLMGCVLYVIFRCITGDKNAAFGS